jgi:peptide/nickel transport system permease protein
MPELVPQGSLTVGGVGVSTWLRSIFRGAPIFSLVVLTVAIVCAIFAPLLAPADPIQADRTNVLSLPSLSQHLLGTDHLGRDILSRMIYGARISVTVGFLAVFVSGAVGTLIALVSGVLRGWVDAVLMRITDAFLALPYLVVAVTVVAILGSSLMNVILVIGLLRWMTYARTIRGEVLRLTELDFIRLARVAGVGRPRVIMRHIFPNIVNTLLVLGTLEVGSAVITEASLSFLGLGIPRPLPSWGAMLAESQTYVFAAWWLPVFPGLAITLLVMASNLTGDWLRDRFDPTRRQL